MTEESATDVKELQDRVPDRVRIYWYPEKDSDFAELRWECLDDEGITLFDSGCGRSGYEEHEEDQMKTDILKICGDVPIVDER